MPDTKREITSDTPAYMHSHGWKLGGRTDDQTILSEIARDYEAAGQQVAFTHAHNTGSVLYWVKEMDNDN